MEKLNKSEQNNKKYKIKLNYRHTYEYVDLAMMRSSRLKLVYNIHIVGYIKKFWT